MKNVGYGNVPKKFVILSKKSKDVAIVALPLINVNPSHAVHHTAGVYITIINAQVTHFSYCSQVAFKKRDFSKF